MLTLFALTFSSIVAVTTPDPTQYDSPLQVSRAVMEVVSIMMALLTLVTEINQLRRYTLWFKQYLFHNTVHIASQQITIHEINTQYNEWDTEESQ